MQHSIEAAAAARDSWNSHLKCVAASKQMQRAKLANKGEGCPDLLKQDTALQNLNCLAANIAAWPLVAFKDDVTM